MVIAIETEAELLHAHYKDTFKYVREREKQRDRLFLILIGLSDLLLIQVQYSNLGQAFSCTIGGVAADFSKIPSWLLLSMTWTLFLALMVRYFQVAIHVDRQFDYIHDLESHVSKLLSPEAQKLALLQRESTAYHVPKGRYFRDLIWIFYSFIFPAILITTIFTAAFQEAFIGRIPSGHKNYDILIAAAGLITIAIYSFRYGIPKIVFPYQKSTSDVSGSEAP